MERSAQRRREESIKNAVLKHEEIFKQQVQELHRLYEVQKKLMSDVRSKELKKNKSVWATSNHHVITDSKNKLRNSKSTSETSHCSNASPLNHSTDVPISKYTSIHRFSAANSSHELSNCLREPLKISRGYNLDQPFEGGSHEPCSSLDLTLSIGCATDVNKRQWKQTENDSSLLLCSNLSRPDGIHEYTNSLLQPNLKSPRWLFQSLSLNRT